MNKWLKKIKGLVLEKLPKPARHWLRIKQLTNQYAKLSKTPSTWKRVPWVILAAVTTIGLMTIFGFIYWEGWIPTFTKVANKSIVQLNHGCTDCIYRLGVS